MGNDGFTVKNGMNVYHDTSTIIIEADSNGVDIHNVQLKANNGLTVSGGTMYVDNNMQVASGKPIPLTNYGDHKTKIDDLHDEIDDIDSCDHVSSCVNDNCYIYFGWSDSCDTCSSIHRWGRINGAWNDYQIYGGSTLRAGSNNDNNNWDNSYALSHGMASRGSASTSPTTSTVTTASGSRSAATKRSLLHRGAGLRLCVQHATEKRAAQACEFRKSRDLASSSCGRSSCATHWQAF